MKFRVFATLAALLVLMAVAYCTEWIDAKHDNNAATPAAPSAEDKALKGLKID